MAAFGESCRDSGHALVSLDDPELPSAIQMLCIAKSLFDDLVSAQQNRWRHRKSKRLGGLEVDDHLKF
jgi:hypothetical protein